MPFQVMSLLPKEFNKMDLARYFRLPILFQSVRAIFVSLQCVQYFHLQKMEMIQKRHTPHASVLVIQETRLVMAAAQSGIAALNQPASADKFQKLPETLFVLGRPVTGKLYVEMRRYPIKRGGRTTFHRPVQHAHETSLGAALRDQHPSIKPTPGISADGGAIIDVSKL